MEKIEILKKINSIYEDIVHADEFGNDHNDRKETRNNFEQIIDPLRELLS
jgi:hypothetical protein